MIYLDTSVALAHLLSEDRFPPPSFFDLPLASSRLLEYEVWNRIHARALSETHAEATRELLEHVAYLDLTRTVLERAREPFPRQVRTLDALHLASAAFLRGYDRSLRIATYDRSLAAAAAAIEIPTFEP